MEGYVVRWEDWVGVGRGRRDGGGAAFPFLRVWFHNWVGVGGVVFRIMS